MLFFHERILLEYVNILEKNLIAVILMSLRDGEFLRINVSSADDARCVLSHVFELF